MQVSGAAPHTSGKTTKAVARAKATSPNGPFNTLLQTAVLRYTGLQSLPHPLRQDLHATGEASLPDAGDSPEARCLRASAPGAISVKASTVTPCLGLYHGGEQVSPVKLRFDLALKSIGAPKDIFVGQCTPGNSSPLCNSTVIEANAEQERLADTLSRQRRYPVATLGVALSF